MSTFDDTGRRDGIIILQAGRGHVREARGLVGRSIRRVLGVRRWLDRGCPHFVECLAASSPDNPYGAPVFSLRMTDGECERLAADIAAAAAAEGWTRAPIDIYHD